ncbi:flagellar brake protein [Marinicellulosiphila megalodicopiae]|uniref:flagellar brake protein n=1 Tax=Marinicellulosiphila megalodicopiae TaxID=2724896 RepID=UPI003BB1279B
MIQTEQASDLSKLSILPGQAVNIELGEDQRFQTQLLGINPHHTVLIATPMLGKNRPLLVRKDQLINVRFFTKKVACAFQCKVRHICTTPYNYLHLTYPSKIIIDEIRRASRVLANVRVQVQNKTQPQYDKTAGGIVDISTVGAKLETIDPIGEVGDVLLLTAMVQIGRIKRLVTWDAHIKTTFDRYDLTNSTAAYGVEFDYLNDLDYLALHGYVNGQIAKGVEI